jgi:hypothetical protein
MAALSAWSGLTGWIESAATLLERERELSELAQATRDVEHGRGRMVVVEASAGLGKTSLLRVACARAIEAGFTCLRARAIELAPAPHQLAAAVRPIGDRADHLGRR